MLQNVFCLNYLCFMLDLFAREKRIKKKKRPTSPLQFLCHISVHRFGNHIKHGYGKHLIEKNTLVPLSMGTKEAVAFLEKVHIQVQYLLH